jgi:hypothetical protein
MWRVVAVVRPANDAREVEGPLHGVLTFRAAGGVQPDGGVEGDGDRAVRRHRGVDALMGSAPAAWPSEPIVGVGRSPPGRESDPTVVWAVGPPYGTIVEQSLNWEG